MGCGGHDVQPSQNVLHQGSMQVLVIAPSPAVAPIDCTLRGGEQGPRAAGEVRNPQPFDSGPVRPVHIQPLDRQFREQRVTERNFLRPQAGSSHSLYFAQHLSRTF